MQLGGARVVVQVSCVLGETWSAESGLRLEYVFCPVVPMPWSSVHKPSLTPLPPLLLLPSQATGAEVAASNKFIREVMNTVPNA